MAKLLEKKIKKRRMPSEGIKRLMERRDELVREKRRGLFSKSWKHLIYLWSEGTFSPATGVGVPESERVKLGDHNCRVSVDCPFPGKVPSSQKGVSWDPENWTEDYVYLLDHSPAEIYPEESIVGEFHWCLEEFRELKYPKEVDVLGYKAVSLGAGGASWTHTIPDLGIGLTLGWKGILEKTRKHREKFEVIGEEKRAGYLRAAEKVCLAIMRYIKKHAEKARSLAEKEVDEAGRKNYLTIAKVCENISKNPPSNFRQAVQWIWLYIVVERIMGHGTGYGRLDQLLKSFYYKDKEEGRLTRDEARDLIAELYMKYSGSFFSIGGRNKNLKDAINELSWICLEAYDMVGGTNGLGVYWHKDIDKDFFAYACDVLARHGSGTPALLNHDIMRESEIYSGYKEKDAWNVAYGGCQWYSVPGREYCGHDVSCLWMIINLMNALKIAFKKNIKSFEELWEFYCDQVDKATRALKGLLDAVYRLQPLAWPEILTSLLVHRCIENGKDVTDCGAVSYNHTSVDVAGLANAADSLYAIKKLVFDERKISLSDLKAALEANYEGYEDIRQLLLNAPKFGNDEDEVDDMARMVVEQMRNTFERYKNCKGFCYRPSLFDFQARGPAGREIGPTPDGRKREEPLAQGPNPMHGRNQKGITATARSIAKLDFAKLQGGPFQLELDSSFLEEENPGKLIEAIATSYFEMGGVHIFVNITSTEILRAAMERPEEFGHLVVRVTGYSAHFVQLDRDIQKEIIARSRHKAM